MPATLVPWKWYKNYLRSVLSRAVYGNCDGGDIRKMFGEKLRWRCEDAEVLMTHIGGYPGKYAPAFEHNCTIVRLICLSVAILIS